MPAWMNLKRSHMDLNFSSMQELTLTLITASYFVGHAHTKVTALEIVMRSLNPMFI
jgi:hypothetical protein